MILAVCMMAMAQMKLTPQAKLQVEKQKSAITGSVLLITFEVSVLHIVLDSLCTSIGSIVFKCEGKDTNLFSNIQFFNAEK